MSESHNAHIRQLATNCADAARVARLADLEVDRLEGLAEEARNIMGKSWAAYREAQKAFDLEMSDIVCGAK